MDSWDRLRRPAPTGPRAAPAPAPSVVPSRAALTELARGFLILQDKDRDRARQFAATFLKEHAKPDAADAGLKPRLPSVRRSATVWTLTDPGPDVAEL